MSFTLQELEKLSGGELRGDPSQKITGAASLAEATPGEISFFANPRYAAQLRKTRAAAIFVPLYIPQEWDYAHLGNPQERRNGG